MQAVSPDSKFNQGDVPKFQFEIWRSDDGKEYYFSGNGFRATYEGGADTLYTALHVLGNSKFLRLKTRAGYTDVESSIFAEVGSDVAVAHHTPEMQVLGLSKAKLMTRSLDTTISPTGASGMFVMINSRGQMSMGSLKIASCVGMVEYSGSTTKGYSGSAYYSGNMIYGMHVGHQGVNLGFASGTLVMFARRTQESSPDYIIKQIEKFGARLDYAVRSPYASGDYQVRFRGEDYFIEEDDFLRINKALKAKGQEYAFESAIDVDTPAAFLGLAPATEPGQPQTCDSAQPATKSIVEEIPESSDKKIQQLERNMDGLRETLAQQSVLLQCIASSLAKNTIPTQQQNPAPIPRESWDKGETAKAVKLSPAAYNMLRQAMLSLEKQSLPLDSPTASGSS